jgi:hypothetical protein
MATGRVDGYRHDVMTSAIVDLASRSAAARPHSAAFGNLPLTIDPRIPANVDLRLAGLVRLIEHPVAVVRKVRRFWMLVGKHSISRLAIRILALLRRECTDGVPDPAPNRRLLVGLWT